MSSTSAATASTATATATLPATFRVTPIPERHADRVRVSRDDGHGNSALEATPAEAGTTPCRVCLEEAAAGEEVLLFSYSPFEKAAAYRNLGPIFVHARQCRPFHADGVPELLRKRLLALRAYDASDRMVGCDVVEGARLETLVERLFADPRAAYVHVHNARPGCFVCRIDRG